MDLLVIGCAVVLTAAIAAVVRFAYRVTRRMHSVRDLPRGHVGYVFYGVVTHVGDGDGFRIFHVPWLRSSKYPPKGPVLSVRLAGVDAPEIRCFGHPAQPFAAEATEYLKGLVHGRMVRIRVLGVDMYGRVLSIVYVRRWLRWVNVNVRMVEAGLACLYTGKAAQYGDMYDELVRSEERAKAERLGMWSRGRVVLPMDHRKQNRGK